MAKIKKDSVLHFPLAGLVGFDPAILFNEKELYSADELLIALALAYNDCKDLLHNWEVLQEFKPKHPGTNISPQYGQFCGMMAHCFRQQVGLLNELLDLLRRRKNVLAKPIFVETASRLKGKAHDGWLNLTAISGATEKYDPSLASVRKLIYHIRNKGAFHYDTDVLKSGFDAHFSKGGPESQRAYISYGKNLEESRFYFADAAIIAYHDKKMGKVAPNFQNLLANYLRDLHPALRGVIGEYLRIRKDFPKTQGK
jgi:hypothetical protein